MTYYSVIKTTFKIDFEIKVMNGSCYCASDINEMERFCSNLELIEA